MITYIAKLQEKYDIPYIHSPNFDPEDFYKNSEGDIMADALCYAVKGKDKQAVISLMKSNQTPESNKDTKRIFFQNATIFSNYVGNAEMIKFINDLKDKSTFGNATL
jgi:hypothetical protein